MDKYQIETTGPDGKPLIVPIPDGFLDMIRDEHAHMLAEKIRGLKDLQPAHWAGVRIDVAADRIDPKADDEPGMCPICDHGVHLPHACDPGCFCHLSAEALDPESELTCYASDGLMT
jgi:hypothetical protein